MGKIVINNDVMKEVNRTGYSVSNVLEKHFAKELSEKRSENPALKSVSATKVALLDAGIDGSAIVDKLFTTEESEFLFPAYISDLVDSTIQQSDILQHMVNGETGIDSLILKAPTLDLLSDENKKNLKKARVAEGADIPVRKVKIGSKSVELYKKAVAMSQTYEALKYSRIDVASIMFRAIANDIVGQNISEVVATLEGCNLQDLGSTSTAEIVTAEELFDACTEYALTYKYAPTTIVASKEMFKSISKIMYDTNFAFGANQKLAINIPQIGMTEISLICADVSKAAGKSRALIYNKEKSIQRFVANGSNISEIQRNILNQTESATLSEISGYGALIESVGVITSA